MMTASVLADQIGAGVHVIEMERAPGFSLGRALHRLSCRIDQAIISFALRRGLKLMASDTAAYQAYVDRLRAFSNRHAPTNLEALVETSPVKVMGPPAGLGPPVPSEWFAPYKGEPDGWVFYVHGGSFIAERSPRITELVARVAAAANARVFAPNYRLAPENPCPAAVEDVMASYAWLCDERPGEPVVALAESAGASILLAALQRLADEGRPLPNAVMLFSPWVDLSLQSWSVVSASLSGTSPYTMESMSLMAHLYLQGRSATDPVASPLFGDFEGFPPMLIHASKGDILYDDAVRLADRMRDVGGDLTVRLWTDEAHVWEQTPTPKARQSVELAAQFIRRHLD
jgi:acetyl esterase/lipase